MKSTTILWVITLLFYYSVFAQQPSLPLGSPPSPNASSLGVYADVPVSKYAGIPNISIPLYSINTSGFILPVSLSYYSSGIKVSQEASSVGLGWALNAGGVITRQIQGKDDFGEFGYVSSGFVIPEESEISDFGDVIQSGLAEPLADVGIVLYPIKFGFPYDTEPDIFVFNFAGYSGRFVLTQDRIPVLLEPESGLIITEYQMGWKITTPLGIIFQFSDYEISKNFSTTTRRYSDGTFYDDLLGEYGSEYFSSWFLSKIILTNGENITFDYTNGSSISMLSTNQEKRIIDHWIVLGVNSSGPSCGNFLMDLKTKSQTHLLYEKYLNKISWSNGHIDFSTSARKDILPDIFGTPLKIDGLSIFDSNDKLIKSYVFDYSYFNESKTAQDPKYWRLKLNSVTELSNDGQEKPPYAFSYETLNGYAYDLPSKTSLSTDFWGYFNGQENIDELGSPMYVPEYENVLADLSFTYHSGANRNSYPEYSKVGILNEIKYPTGGISRFEYESNTYFTNDHYYNEYEEATFTAKACNYEYCNYWGNPSELQPVGVQEFYVEKGPWTRAFISTFSENFAASFPIPQGSYGNLSKLTGENGTVVEEVANFNYYGDDYYCCYSTPLPPLPACEGCYPHDERIYLSPGWYRITASPAEDLYAEVSITIQKRTEEVTRYGAGLRIAKISDDAKERFFEYSWGPVQSTFSKITSGVLLSKPDYSFFETEVYNCSTVFEYEREMFVRRSGSISALTGIKSGQSIGYGQVNEYLKDDNGNISVQEQTFINSAETPNSIFFPNIPRLNNGLLRWEKYYKNSNLVQETTYNYTLDEETQSTVAAFMGLTINNWGFYHLLSEWHKLSKKETINYFENELNPVTSTTNYFYDNAQHFQLTRTESTNSKGELLKSNTFYPDDKALLTGLTPESSTAIDSLINQHRIVEPIQQESYKNGLLTASQRTNYKDWGLSASGVENIIQPDTIQTSKGSGSLEDRIVYHDYYPNGNIKEVSKTNGTHAVYIWGYNETQPIAKIENATFTDIPSAIYNEILSKSDLDNDHCREVTCKEQELRVALNKLSDKIQAPNLSKSQITTYTYDPLIGVTSITDPRGETIYYHYDNFNRLEFVKEAQGKILSEKEYHYKNQ